MASHAPAQGMKCCCPCSNINDDDDVDIGVSSQEPLLPSQPHLSMGRPVRTYGTQRRQYTASSAQVFGVSPVKSTRSSTVITANPPVDPLESWPEVLETLNEIQKETPKKTPSKKKPVEEPEDEKDSSESEDNHESTESSESEGDDDGDENEEGSGEEGTSVESRDDSGSTTSGNHDDTTGTEGPSNQGTSFGEPAPSHLSVLADAYLTDRGVPLYISTWPEILPPTAEVEKIAEASFAEVYRVSTSAGSSIIKVLQLKIPTDAASSDIETAINAADLVSEIRIMNVLTEVPGFVGFKDAHLIRGRFAPSLQEAYYEFIADDGVYEPRETHFPGPDVFTEDSTFLVLELADAGNVLEDVAIESIDQVWDIFLGVCMALSRAEYLCEFEHRDLHENNVCVKQKTNSPKKTKGKPKPRDGPLRYGSSGYDITIIDYGLSRAKIENGDIVFQDLENDLELFHSTGSGLAGMQFDNYRRMRNYLLSGTRTMQPASFHTTPFPLLPSSTSPSPSPSPSPSCPTHPTWRTHTPYSNVLWIRYILSFLTKQLKKHTRGTILASKATKDLAFFEAEIKELKRRLDVRTKVENGAFESACQVLDYVFVRGWVSEEQLGEVGEVEVSLLSVGRGR